MRKAIFGSLLTLALVAAIVTAQATGIILLPGSNTLKSLHFQGYPGLGIYSSSTGVMFIGDTTSNGITCTSGNGCTAALASASVGTTSPTVTDTSALGTSSLLFTNLFRSQSIQGSKSQILTDAGAAVASVTVAIPTNGHIAGTIGWTAKSLSGTDQLVAVGDQRWWGTDTAGTPVCGINKIGTDGEGHSGGANTLVCTWTNVVATTNCVLSVTCTNDLAAAQAITLYRSVTTQIPATLTFN